MRPANFGSLESVVLGVDVLRSGASGVGVQLRHKDLRLRGLYDVLRFRVPSSDLLTRPENLQG